VVLEAIQELRPRAVVVDSIQTVYLPEATGSAGSVIQVVFSGWLLSLKSDCRHA
jgi:predicted ATP-dependent serine protease